MCGELPKYRYLIMRYATSIYIAVAYNQNGRLLSSIRFAH